MQKEKRQHQTVQHLSCEQLAAKVVIRRLVALVRRLHTSADVAALLPVQHLQ